MITFTIELKVLTKISKSFYKNLVIMKVRELFIIISIIVVLAIIGIAFIWPPILWAFLLVGPLVTMGLFDVLPYAQIGRVRRGDH